MRLWCSDVDGLFCVLSSECVWEVLIDVIGSAAAILILCFTLCTAVLPILLPHYQRGSPTNRRHTQRASVNCSSVHARMSVYVHEKYQWHCCLQTCTSVAFIVDSWWHSQGSEEFSRMTGRHNERSHCSRRKVLRQELGPLLCCAMKGLWVDCCVVKHSQSSKCNEEQLSHVDSCTCYVPALRSVD